MRFLFLCCLFLFSMSLFAEKVIWSGTVSASGEPTPDIPLELRGEYIIRSSGVVNVDKWIEGKEKFSNDACYSFGTNGKTEGVVSLQNSLNVPMCTGTYLQDHVYESAPFTADQNRIHFWVYDIDYDDNNGEFDVEIIELN